MTIKTTYANTVTYGTVSASFLATECLCKLAEDEFCNLPAACILLLKNDFYIDYYLDGENMKEKVVMICKKYDNSVVLFYENGRQVIWFYYSI